MWILWLIFCVVVGVFASGKGRSGIGWAFLAFLISPLIAGVILACIKDLSVAEDITKVTMENQHLKDRVVANEKLTDYRLGRVEGDVNRLQNNQSGNLGLNKNGTQLLEEGNKLCPACAESIKVAAIKCKHCGVMVSDYVKRTCNYCAEEIGTNDSICSSCKSSVI